MAYFNPQTGRYHDETTGRMIAFSNYDPGVDRNRSTPRTNPFANLGGGGGGGGVPALPDIAAMVGNMVGRVVSTLTGGVQTLMQRVTQSLAALLLTITGTLLLGITLASGGLRSFTNALSEGAKGALQFAQSALSIRSQTGLSYGQSGGLLTRGLAFGMSPGQTANAFGPQNPLFFGMRSSVFGLPNYTNGNYFSSLSSWFNGYLQQGPMGAMMGNNMLNAMYGGRAPDQIRNIAAMNPKLVREQEQWQNGLWDKLGVSSSAIQRMAEVVPLLTARLQTLAQVGFLRLMDAVGPSLVRALERLTGFFTNNMERIAPIASRVIESLSVVMVRGLERVLSFLESHADGIEGFVMGAFDFLFTALPRFLMQSAQLILKAVEMLLRGFGYLMLGLSKGAARLLELLPVISQFFENLTQSFLQHLPEISQALAQGFNVFREFILSVVNFVEQAVGQVRGMLGLNRGPNGEAPTGQPQGVVNQAANFGGRLARNAFRAVTGVSVGDPNDGSAFQNTLNTLAGWGLGAQAVFGRGGGGLPGMAMRGANRMIGRAAGGVWNLARSGLMRVAHWGMMNTVGIGAGRLGLTLPGVATAAAAGWPLLLGGGLGIAGYEGARALGDRGVWGFGRWQGMPSTLGIAGHYLFGTNPYGGNALAHSGARGGGGGAGVQNGVGTGGVNTSGRNVGGIQYGGAAGWLQNHIPPMDPSGYPGIWGGMATRANHSLQRQLSNLGQHLPTFSANTLNLSNEAFRNADGVAALQDQLRQMALSLENIDHSNREIERHTQEAPDKIGQLIGKNIDVLGAALRSEKINKSRAAIRG